MNSNRWLAHAFGPDRAVYETTLDGRTSRQSIKAGGLYNAATLEARCADFERRVTANGGTFRRILSPDDLSF